MEFFIRKNRQQADSRMSPQVLHCLTMHLLASACPDLAMVMNHRPSEDPDQPVVRGEIRPFEDLNKSIFRERANQPDGIFGRLVDQLLGAHPSALKGISIPSCEPFAMAVREESLDFQWDPESPHSNVRHDTQRQERPDPRVQRLAPRHIPLDSQESPKGGVEVRLRADRSGKPMFACNLFRPVTELAESTYGNSLTPRARPCLEPVLVDCGIGYRAGVICCQFAESKHDPRGA